LIESSLKYFLDLLLLNDLEKSNSHAYIIIKNINHIVQESYALRDATIYNALKRLEADQLIIGQSVISNQNGRKRYVYHLSDLGKEKLESLKSDWLTTSKIINQVMKGDYIHEKH